MNTQIHSPHSFYFKSLILILLLSLQGFSLSAVAELLIEPTIPAVTVGQSITLSVSGASGEVIWTPTKGNIQGMGTSVTYVAPTQPGADAVMVLDGAGNVEVIKIEVSSANSFTLENAVWRVFTNRSWIRAILLSEDRKTLWIGTTGGLELRDAITEKLERVYTALDGLPNNNVGALVSDGNGGLWVGTVGGLAHRNNNEEWTVFNTDNSDLPDNSVNTLMSDGKGGLWIGTEGGGLAFLSENQEWRHIFNTDNSQLPNNAIQTIVSDGNSGLWLGTSDGLAHLNSHGEWKSFKADHSELPNNQVNVLLNAGNDGLWIGTAGGLVHLSLDEKWQVFNTDNSGLPDNNVDAILNDGNRGLWVGTGKLGNKTGGLAYLNNSQEWTVYHVENSELPSNRIRTLANDGNDRLWIGTWGRGLVRLKEHEWRLLDNSYLPGGNAVLALMSEIDETDDLWIGTSFGGLAHLNNRNQLTTFDLSPL
ncbi:MAG: two-component regulator propeller domain-containing protein, partial [Candidatus Parabeggiatoa sp.]|nr:two-component regulator propeller domain-containing protein [Candidatus Parabeggiatoa sp.]